MKTTFGVVGGGWRTEYFLRIARDCPEQFSLAGVVVRDAEKRRKLAAKWGCVVFATVEELIAKRLDFVVTAVPWAANSPLIEQLVAAKVAVLSETPIAPTLPEMVRIAELVAKGAKIQVAEQYLFQPHHAARLNLASSGLIGEVSEATVSIAHGYHGLSLVRHYLRVGFALPKITARRFMSPIVDGPGRAGPPSVEKIKEAERVVAWLDFGDRLGIFDFTGEQYFSWIRSPQLLLRGARGEVNGMAVRRLVDFRTPEEFALQRRDLGQAENLEGYSLHRIEGGGRTWYENVFVGQRWSDDEIAVATSLAKMGEYVRTGAEFYSAAEACQDRYLDLLLDQAVTTGLAVVGGPQPWMPAIVKR